MVTKKTNGTKNGKDKPTLTPLGTGKRGRPSKLTQELTDAICCDILIGGRFDNAILAHGVSQQLKSVWVMRGKKEDEEGLDTVHAYFYRNISQVESQAKVKAEQKVFAGGSDWQSSARWLESADQKNWSRYEKHEVSGPGGGPVKILVVEDGNSNSN